MMLVVTPKNLEHAKKLAKLNVAGLAVGSSDFGMRLAGEFSFDEIKDLVGLGPTIFVMVNAPLYDDGVAAMRNYLTALASLDGVVVVFADYGILKMVQVLKLDLELMYFGDTMATNRYYPLYLEKFKVCGVELAKEITLAEVGKICEASELAISINIHGQIYMYHSMRPLIKNYSDNFEEKIEGENLVLYDEERKAKYRMYTEKSGTHIMAKNDLALIHHLDKVLKLGVSYLKFDGFGYTEDEITEITKLYCGAIGQLLDNEEDYLLQKKKWLAELSGLSVGERIYSTGFSFKETTY